MAAQEPHRNQPTQPPVVPVVTPAAVPDLPTLRTTPPPAATQVPPTLPPPEVPTVETLPAPALAWQALYLPEWPWGVVPRITWQEHSLVELLDTYCATMRRVYLAGGQTAQYTPRAEWWHAPALSGWRITRLRTGDPNKTGARYISPSGRQVDVSMTAAWFGKDPGCSDASACERALKALKKLLGERFDKGVTLFGTPSRTGLDLLQRTLPHDKHSRRPTAWYQPVPDLVGHILRHNFGQGRFDYLAPAAGITGRDYERLFVLDGRWMYASCVRDLPTGPCLHDDEPTYEPYRPGVYRVVFQAPPTWRYPFGLLPVLDETSGEPFWPVDQRRWYEGWCGEPELRLAAAMEWPFAVRERIVWTAPTPGDPARGWVTRLVDARGEVEYCLSQNQPGAFGGWVSARLVHGALRNLLVGGVGGWFREAGIDEQETPDALRHTIPAAAFGEVPVPNWQHPVSWRWKIEAPLSADLAAFEHPEWAVMVWSRARAKIAAAAIKYSDEHWGNIVDIRSDSLVVTAPPNWHDDGKPGTFRPKPPGGIGPLPGEQFITLPDSKREWYGDWRRLVAPRGEVA